MTYKRLNLDDVIQEGDEYFDEYVYSYFKFKKSIGMTVAISYALNNCMPQLKRKEDFIARRKVENYVGKKTKVMPSI